MSQDSTSDSFLSNNYFRLSLIVLLLGILFVLGEVFALDSFLFLNTFTYIDFVINSVLIIPFIIIALLFYSALNIFFSDPVRAGHELLLSCKLEEKEKKKKILSVIHALTGVLRTFIFPVILIFLILNPFLKLVAAKELVAYLIGSLVLGLVLLIISSKTRKYAVKSNFEPLKKTENILYQNIGTPEGVFTMSFFVFFSGYLYIELQDKEKNNATLMMKDTKKSLKVKVITSNSNVLAVFRDSKFEIIKRSDIYIITYNKQIPSKKKSSTP